MKDTYNEFKLVCIICLINIPNCLLIFNYITIVQWINTNLIILYTHKFMFCGYAVNWLSTKFLSSKFLIGKTLACVNWRPGYTYMNGYISHLQGMIVNLTCCSGSPPVVSKVVTISLYVFQFIPHCCNSRI